MKKPLIIVNWILWNGAKWAFLMAGGLGGAVGPMKVGMAMVWVSFVASILALFMRKSFPRRPDEWLPTGVAVLDVLIDLGLVVLLTWRGHWVLSLLVFLTASLGIHKRLEDLREIERLKGNPELEEERKNARGGITFGRWLLTQSLLATLFWFGFIQGQSLAHTFAIVLLTAAILLELTKFILVMTDVIGFKDGRYIDELFAPKWLWSSSVLFHLSCVVFIIWSGHWAFGIAWTIYAVFESMTMLSIEIEIDKVLKV